MDGRHFSVRSSVCRRGQPLVHASAIPTLAKNTRVGQPQCGVADGRVQVPDPSKREIKDMKKRVSCSKKNQETRATAIHRTLAKAQLTVRKHVSPKTSLVDELIAERREAARHE
jgi:hypothetical protein